MYKKNERFCGPGCQCLNCSNLQGGGECTKEVNLLEMEGQRDTWEEDEYIDDSDSEELDDNTCNVDDEDLHAIMTSVFGEDFEEA